MTAWTNKELDRVGTAQELGVASLRADGTLRQPVTIWVIREGDDLYVRSWRGRSGACTAASRSATRVTSGPAGSTRKSTSSRSMTTSSTSASTPPIGPSTAGTGRTYVEPMTSGETRTTTLRLEPRAAKGSA